MLSYTDEVNKIGKNMQENLKKVRKLLRTAPDGSLQIIKEGDYIGVYQTTYEDGSTKRHGIKRNPKLIKALARKEYYLAYEKVLIDDIETMNLLAKDLTGINDDKIKKYLPSNIELLDDVLLWKPQKMHPVMTNAVAVQNYSLIVSNENMDTWAEMPYRANDYHGEAKKQKSPEGIAMRSKSEIAIFEIYKKLNIPVHYDELINFNGKLKSPDFLSMRFDGKLIYHEHCGLVNNPEYVRTHYEKMHFYKSVGIVPWDNLIVTYDNGDGVIDLELVEAEIRAKLLR